MRGRAVILIGAWLLIVCGISLLVGAGVFGLIGTLLDQAGIDQNRWPGDNSLFYGLVVGLPCLAGWLTLVLGLRGRLPGLRPSPES